jgi:hypothetical protein
MTIESLVRELQGAVSRACANLHQIRPEAHAKVIEEAARPHVAKLAAATAKSVAAARQRVEAARGVVDSAAGLLGRGESADQTAILRRDLAHREIRDRLLSLEKGRTEFIAEHARRGNLEPLVAAESDPVAGLIAPEAARELRLEVLREKAPNLFARLAEAEAAERQARRQAGEMAAEVGKTIADAIPATHARLRTIGQRVTPHELFAGDQVPEAAGEPLNPIERLKEHRRASSSPAPDLSDAPAA